MTRYASMLAVLAVCFGTSSCATAHSRAELVRKRAVFDLSCQEQLNIVDLGNGKMFGVTGCGKRASYAVLCTGLELSSCVAMLEEKTASK